MATPRRPHTGRSPESFRTVLRRVLLGACAMSVAALAAAAPAGAVNATLGGNSFGFQPRDAAKPATVGQLVYHGGPVMHSTSTYAVYWDPPTPAALTGNFDADWKSAIDGYFANVASDSGTLHNEFSLLSQYSDAGGGRAAYKSTFMGALTDTQAYPVGGCPVGTTCLTDAAIRTELSRFLSANGLSAGMGTVFHLFTPPGVTVCTDSSGTDCSSPSAATSFCSYHSFIGTQSAPGPATVIYAVQPWTAGDAGMWNNVSGGFGSTLATDCQDGSTTQQEPNQIAGVDLDGDYDTALSDVLITELGVQQVNVATNPLLNGWYENATSAEEADQCRDNFAVPTPGGGPGVGANTLAASVSNENIGAGHYYLQNVFNLDAVKLDYPNDVCKQSTDLTVAFTIPTAVNPGDHVAFDATESAISMGPAAYSWNFGDGSPAVTGASVTHSYGTPGTYTITLTATDQGANTASVQRQLAVNGSVPPPSTTTGSATSSAAVTGSTPGPTTIKTAGGAGSPGGKSGGAPPATAGKAPVAFEQILSRSLKGARRTGVTVGYRVDQAVAGRFQVMIDAATAKRLHIKGAHVAGGAASRSSAVVIGSAILVTLQGGGSRLAIHFTKSAASHLGHAHSLPITVKMTVAADGGGRTVMDAAATLR